MKRGFALSELLIVIAVMVILMAAAFPAVRAIQSAIDSADTLPVLLEQARVAAMRSNHYAACIITRQPDGTNWGILVVEDTAYPYTPADGDMVAMVTGNVMGMHSKPRKVPADYTAAVVLYNKHGHCCPHRNLRVDGIPQKSVAALDRGGTMRYLHRYLGGFVR